MPGAGKLDQSSLSNPHEAIVTHLTWTADVDFTSSTLRGTAEYEIKLLTPDATCIKLDTSRLDVKSVSVNGTPSKSYTLSPLVEEKAYLGQCLQVPFNNSGSNIASSVKVSVQYETTEKCTALQWLPPSQTAGKRKPYLFSQCQAIHARSMVPCQDCPGVKMTYDATITVPSWATCIMSALSQSASSQSDEVKGPGAAGAGLMEKSESKATYQFHQPVPIPSYLLAIVVGDLASIDISPRCRVWSEPSVVEAAAYEFAETESFLRVAESLTFSYEWGRYDLLCLPPSFPYGGMENPCLTFVTPTLLAGDRSLADVVAHEISHSWTGNLVTNATWEHFWLNEGWTVWLQRKITSRMKNEPKWIDFEALSGWEDLKEDVNLMPEEATKLVPTLGDQDPDEGYSSVPYEKGFHLLWSLERRVGTDAFEGFAKQYMMKFKFSTVTSEQFRSFFEESFPNHPACQDVDWDAWFYRPGMPPETPKFDRSFSQVAEDLAQAWLAFNDAPEELPPPRDNITGWSSHQVVCFLDAITAACEKRERPLKKLTVISLHDKYGMRESKNAEVLFRYCKLAIAAGETNVLPAAVRFISTQGRMKYVRPLYRELVKSTMGKYVAFETFLSNEKFYHPIAAKMIAKDLQVSMKRLEADEEDSEDEEKRSLVGAPLWLLGVGVLVTVGLVALRRRKR